jgi:hypothetical protein
VNETSNPPPAAPGEPPAGGPLSPAGHVTLAGLADYREHRLPEDVHDRLQEHLVDCAECREQAIDFGAFFDPPDEGEEAEIDVPGGWERLREGLRTQAPAPPGKGNATGKAAKLAFKIAAVLVLGAVGLYAARWYGRGEKVLLPAETFRSASPETAIDEVSLPVLLELRSPEPRPRPAYRADLFDDQGRRVRSFPDLVESSDLFIRISLPRWSLHRGDYHFELRAASEGLSPLLGSYPFRVR